MSNNRFAYITRKISMIQWIKIPFCDLSYMRIKIYLQQKTATERERALEILRKSSAWFYRNPWILYIVLPFISLSLLLHSVLAYAIARRWYRTRCKNTTNQLQISIQSTRITLLLSRAHTYANVYISFNECIRWKFTPNHAKMHRCALTESERERER